MDELLASVRPDVVHVCPPPSAQVDAARAALDAGAHVYVEKPFALRTADARSLLDAAVARGSLVCHDQFAPELLYFSDCILKNREPEPSGEEGLQDVRIVQALYKSAASGRPVALRPFTKRTRPTGRQRITRPGVRKPALVKVQSASED